MTKPLTQKQQHWSQILESAEQSGLSLAAFARQNELPAKDLYRWRNQLKKVTQSVGEMASSPIPFTQIIASPSAVEPCLSLQLPQARLQFTGLPSPEWLAQLLAQPRLSL